MERRLKQIHAEMLALRNKGASGIKLRREERYRLRQLAAEHDGLAFALPAHSLFNPQSQFYNRDV
jgi:hypothetical protein